LKRLSYERSDEEILVLVSFTKDFDFFVKLNSKVSQVNNKLHEKCCQKMKY